MSIDPRDEWAGSGGWRDADLVGGTDLPVPPDGCTALLGIIPDLRGPRQSGFAAEGQRETGTRAEAEGTKGREKDDNETATSHTDVRPSVRTYVRMYREL